MSDIKDLARPLKSTPENIDVEIIIDDMSRHQLLVRTDEDAKPVQLPRHGTKLDMAEETLPYATLTLSESKAISYNLV